MNAEQKMVRQFHDKFGILGHNTPQFAGSWSSLGRSRFIHEEAAEFTAACAKRDIVEIADALGDLLYVVYGAADVFGIDLEPIFKEIHHSNMNKEGIDHSGKVKKGKDWSPPDIYQCLLNQGYAGQRGCTT